MKKINCYFSRRSKFSKDHRDKTEVPDPLVVENLISLNDDTKISKADYTIMRYMFSVTP